MPTQPSAKILRHANLIDLLMDHGYRVVGMSDTQVCVISVDYDDSTDTLTEQPEWIDLTLSSVRTWMGY